MGALGGLTPDSLLYSPPIYRNFLLADAARQYGYCEKAGTGVDKIYYHLILNGFEFPIFDAGRSSFSVLIRTRRDRAFARFVKEFAGTLDLRLSDLIVLRVLRSRSSATGPDLARRSQRPIEYMRDVLSDL